MHHQEGALEDPLMKRSPKDAVIPKQKKWFSLYVQSSKWQVNAIAEVLQTASVYGTPSRKAGDPVEAEAD